MFYSIYYKGAQIFLPHLWQLVPGSLLEDTKGRGDHHVISMIASQSIINVKNTSWHIKENIYATINSVDT